VGSASGDEAQLITGEEKRVMSNEETTRNHGAERQPEPLRVKLPGFLVEQETGLGDIVKRVTYAMGIKPCRGCERRAVALNRWVQFLRRR
jgi:hypothetical protein